MQHHCVCLFASSITKNPQKRHTCTSASPKHAFRYPIHANNTANMHFNYTPAFVGRQGELGLHQQKLDAMLNRTGSTVFIAGDSGVGKTRLVEEFLSYVTQQHEEKVFSEEFIYKVNDKGSDCTDYKCL
jgi:predicted ATPase